MFVVSTVNFVAKPVLRAYRAAVAAQLLTARIAPSVISNYRRVGWWYQQPSHVIRMYRWRYLLRVLPCFPFVDVVSQSEIWA